MEDSVHKASGLILATIFSLTLSDMAHAADSIFRVTLLGTGVPDPDPNRFSASTLIEAGDHKLLIDVGRGATIRLYQLHIPLSKIDVVFFTHYHSDHTIGLPDLLSDRMAATDIFRTPHGASSSHWTGWREKFAVLNCSRL
jgi:metal-dependent hydrolase (beta-lactamase superfamily II)